MTEVIKQFLVGLSFGVDDASLSKFSKAINNASVKVLALYGSIQAFATGTFYAIAKVSEGFEQMGYEYRIIAPAINKALVLRNELLRAYRAAGINIQSAVVQAVKFNMALTKTQFAVKAIYSSVAVKFFPLLTKQLDQFRKTLYSNLPKIQAGLERFVKFVFKAFEATVQLGARIWSILGRVYDFFKKLHDATDGWSTVILAAIAAWKLLNLEFLATPLGLILTGLTAILALYDDFKTWQEGGKSLFDWSTFIPVINAVTAALSSMKQVLGSVLDIVGNLVLAFVELFRGNWSAAWGDLKSAAQSLTDTLVNLWSAIKSTFGAIGATGSWVSSLFGDKSNAANAAANIANNAQTVSAGTPLRNPVGTTNTNNSSVNQNVQQQTSINVFGSADANATAIGIASQQQRVNFDLSRNLKVPTR